MGLHLRLRARFSVHRHRAADRRALAVAVVLLTSPPVTGRAARHHQHHRQGDARGFLSTHPCGVTPGTIVRLAVPTGQFRDAGSGAASGAVHHRRPGDHPGHVDAAHPARHGQITDVVHVQFSSAPPKPTCCSRPNCHPARDASQLPADRVTSLGQGRLDSLRLGEVVPDWRDRLWCGRRPGGHAHDAERIWNAAGLGEKLHPAVHGLAGGAARHRRRGDSSAAVHRAG